MELKAMILQAYGTCDYLAGENGLDMRKELSVFLIWYEHFLHPDQNLDSFVKEYLLLPGDPKTFLSQALQAYTQQKMEEAGAQLYDDFIWADELLNQYHPGFSNSNTRLFVNLCEALADTSGAKQEAEQILKHPSSVTEEEPSEKLQEALRELQSLTGLESVKDEVNRLMALIRIGRIRQEKGLKAPKVSMHMVFLGNPGTGKTTVARIIGSIYKELHVLSKGQLIETDRSGLVAGHVGQTALKTKEVIDSAIGGVLFIDEAYTLHKESKNDFGQEAIETLLKAMEDHRDDLVVIVAGYPDLMMEFLRSNPGLSSRFNKFISFENYTPDQLVQILKSMATAQDYEIEQPALDWMKQKLDTLMENPPENFGNAREMRNQLEQAICAQAVRLISIDAFSEENLRVLKAEDFGAPASV